MANPAKTQTEMRPQTDHPLPVTWTAEIIAVGTELLMGEVVNSNASWLSAELAKIGINVYYHTVVGDNPARIQSVFQTALSRSNLLLVTGGLGPTDDDLTIATLAQLLDTPMVNDPHSEVQIRQFFITRDMKMSQTNLKQALRPDNAEPVFNRLGTAPGVYWDVSQKVAQRGWGTGPRIIAAMPGVPREMKAMWTEVILPRLLPMFGQQDILVSRSLKFVGIGESMLGETLRDLMAQETPTVSPYVGQAEVRIRIAAKDHTEAKALAKIQPVETEIMARVGRFCYGKDEEQLEEIVGRLLLEKHLTLSVAESCTGGLVSSRLTDVPGSSAYILMNAVTYSNAAKEELLRVSPQTLLQFGAVSAQVAAEMAMGILKAAGTDIGIGITGIGGPAGGSPEKPVGLAYVGLAKNTGECPVVKKISVNPQYPREFIKYWFSHYALNYCRLYLLGLLDPDE